ncbi:hypothetical protein NQ317_012147, partial [Molorchus minor]
LISESASDKMSLHADDYILKDSYAENNRNTKPPPDVDILAPPPNVNPNNSSLTSAETYASPHSDCLTNTSAGSGTNPLPPAGSALSAHHEIQLMREQLEQQGQQTQAAMAQLQLVREQLAAEQTARLEAQARTHQLLIHNRELLDHIAALVAHLQGEEKIRSTTNSSTHGDATVLELKELSSQEFLEVNYVDVLLHHLGQVDNYKSDISESASLDNSPVLKALGLNTQGLIENRVATSCLPPSPLRNAYNPTGSAFNFTYPPVDTTSYESQLLQRLQALNTYNPPSPFPYGFSQTLPFLSPSLYNQSLLNNNYTLQPPPQKNVPQSPLSMRHSYAGNMETESQLNSTRDSEHRQTCTHNQFQTQHNATNYLQSRQYQREPKQNPSNQHLQVEENSYQQRSVSPAPQNSPKNERQSQFIKPLAQMGTLTTTDSEGRVRVIVPVPSRSNEDTDPVLSNLRISDDFRLLNGPPITRSTSEKVPNRSELMSQVQRTAWARHTTK